MSQQDPICISSSSQDEEDSHDYEFSEGSADAEDSVSVPASPKASKDHDPELVSLAQMIAELAINEYKKHCPDDEDSSELCEELKQLIIDYRELKEIIVLDEAAEGSDYEENGDYQPPLELDQAQSQGESDSEEEEVSDEE